MGALSNPRYETFAQALAKGQSASRAYVLAGFKESRQNGHRLGLRDYIRARVTEIKETRLATPEDTGRDDTTGQFILGHPNRGGRPRGARNKLAEQFIADINEEWQRRGKATLRVLSENDLTKVVANLMPKLIDTKLDARLEIDVVDLDAYAEAKGFLQAFRFCRDRIGADMPLLELEAQPVGEAAE